MKIVRPKGPEIFDIELEKDLLAKNRGLAKKNRKRFDRSKILAVDVMGSIGSGKTSLIKAVLKRLYNYDSLVAVEPDFYADFLSVLVKAGVDPAELVK